MRKERPEVIRVGVQARFSIRNEHKMGTGRNKRQETHSVRKGSAERNVLFSGQ